MENLLEESLKNYYRVCLDLVLKAGDHFRTGFKLPEANIHMKAEFYNFATDFDIKIEELLIGGLQKSFPNSKIIAEEACSEGNIEPTLTDDPTWIIDPIDGTTNFVKRIPHCCISVGLSINKELVMGIIYNPIVNELYTAWKGHGAYLNGEEIRVSKNIWLYQSVIGYEVSLLHHEPTREKNAKRMTILSSSTIGTRSFGSAALSLCYVAKGSLDAYHVDDLKPWDIAAGAVILREAGGYIIGSDGKEFDIMKPNLIAAGTAELCEHIKESINLVENLNVK